MLSRLNHNFIILIPKIEDSKTLNYFKPISLCNNIYNIISKVATNRLKLVIISPYLFIILAKALSKGLKHLLYNDHILGLNITNGDTPITHSQFADNTMIITKPNIQETIKPKGLLHSYELASG